MVYPKQAYFGHAYKAIIPFHLRRQQAVRKPRSAYNIYNLVSDEVLWDLYVNNAIDLKELYLDFTSTSWHRGILIPLSTSDELGSTASTSSGSVSSISISSPSESEDDKMEMKTSDSDASKKDEASVEMQELQPKNEMETKKALLDEPVAGPSGLQAPYKRQMKKRKSELDTLYLPEEFIPDPEKRKQAWKGPPFDNSEESITDVDSDSELDEERTAKKAEKAKKRKKPSKEPQPSTSKACGNGSETVVNDTVQRLSTIMRNFFSSMPGQDYRRPSMKLQAQVVDTNGEKKFICPVCKKEESEHEGDMISCDKCGDWYHFTCVGIKGEYQKKRRWYCKRCVFRAVNGKKFEPAEFPLFE